jgi:hypothetical protein
LQRAPGEGVRTRRKRKRAPKPRDTATTYRFNNPNHDTPPVEPVPTYGSGRLSTPSSTLDRILAAGAGPLNLPAGKIDIPRRSTAPPRLSRPVVEPPARGEQQPQHGYQSLFGKGGRTVVPPATQAMLEHATGNKHEHQAAQYLLDARDSEDLHKRALELGFDPTSDLNNLVHAIDSAFGAPTHNIAGFPQTGRTALPEWQRAYLKSRGVAYEQATGKDLHLPKNPTDQDIVRYSYGVPAHSGSYWDVLKNLPRDAVETPLYAFQGGYATGHAIQGFQDYLTRPHEGAGSFLNPLANRLQDSGLRKNIRQIDRQHRSQQGIDTQALETRVENAKNKLSRAQQERVLAHEAMGFTPEELAGFRGAEPSTREPLSPAEEEYRQALEDYRVASEDAMQEAGLLGSGARLHREADPLAQVLADQGHPLANRYLEVNDELSTLQRQLAKTPHGDKRAVALEREIRDLRNRREQSVSSRVAALDEQIARTRQLYSRDAVRNLKPGQRPRTSVLRDEIKRLEQRRTNLLRSQQPHSDITSARIRRLEQRLQDTPTRGRLQGQLDQAFTDRNDLLQQLVDERTGAGMPRPTRIPFRPLNERPGFFQRGGGGPGGVKKRGQRRYEGGRFRSGEYEPPTHADVMRDIRAPLNEQTYNRVANYILNPDNGIAVRAEPGAPVPEDMVLVEPPQETPPNVEPTSDRVRRGESIFSRVDSSAGEVPEGQGYAFVPRLVFEDMQARAEQLGKGRPGGKVSQGLRNVLLYSRPSYALTNLVGNVQQGLLEGTGPLSYARAGRNKLPVPAGVEEGGAVRVNFSAYGEALADKINGQHPARAAATVLGHPIAAYTQLMRHAAQSVEDFTRRGTYLKNAVPAARNIAHADDPAFKRFAASFRGVDEATRRVLEQMAKGEGAPGGAVELAAKDAMQSVDRVLGDYASLPSHPFIDIAFPFHRWAQFASRLLAVTLPVHYPGRALILYRLGALGQEAQNQIGPLTPSLQGIIPVGNDPQDILALNTSYPNTFATLGEALAPDPRGSSEIAGLNPVGAGSYLSPIARLAQALITGVDPTTGFTYTNPRGEGIIKSDRDHPADPNATEDFLRLVAGQTLSMIPPLRLAFSPVNSADTSIPLPGLTQTRYTPPDRPGFLPAKPSSQLDLSPEQRLFNFVSPFRVRRINLEDLAQQGVIQTKDRLRATQRKESR